MMELSKLFNLEIPLKAFGDWPGQKIQKLDGEKITFLEALNRLLTSLELVDLSPLPVKEAPADLNRFLSPETSGAGHSLAGKIKANLFETLQLTKEKTEVEGEDSFNLLTGLENIIIPPFNREIKEQTELIANTPLTGKENKNIIPHSNAIQGKNGEGVISSQDNLLTKISDREKAQQIPFVLGEPAPEEVIPPGEKQEVFVQDNKTINEVLKDEPALFKDFKHPDYSLEDGQTAGQKVEYLEEENKKSFLAEPTLFQTKKEFPKTDNNNFNRSFSNKEANSSLAVMGKQTFSGLVEDNYLPIPREPGVTPKELPEFLLKQINNNIKYNKLTGTTELSLKLKPEELGKVTLKLLAQDGQVNVKIITENTRAREIVEQNLGHLKQTLANQGIKCAGIDVQVNSDSSFQQFMGGNQSNPFNQPRYANKGRYSPGTNGRKQLLIEGLASPEGSGPSLKRTLDGLELFA